MLRVAVLVSGRGSNLQALIDAVAAKELAVDIVVVGSNKVAAEGLRRAEAAGIATFALDPAGYADRAGYDREFFERLGEYAPDLVVLAGFMRVIDPAALAPWIGRVINIHPSLLPKYAGLKTHARALAAGDARHGASVHYVTAELDGGPVIAQVDLAIEPGDTPDSLATRLLPLEHRLLRQCVAWIADGKVALAGERVHVDGVARDVPPLVV
ncbi:phosphoribosylglycinamide formyltransferase [Tahibacter soli]|uniref:Phosphoribosylglycinamide formyltransferase n=1 Tax=Tahibacter soli TaxID=2983605 RepID=A0A9X4BIB2_9GAMM|nr:phosphoribosylglycinamide formyltransferase [Tahibacter soli]MDC8012057.1 phosphoribosylglycinamide formyltransferase [Tahibacter soli]